MKFDIMADTTLLAVKDTIIGVLGNAGISAIGVTMQPQQDQLTQLITVVFQIIIGTLTAIRIVQGVYSHAKNSQ